MNYYKYTVKFRFISTVKMLQVEVSAMSHTIKELWRNYVEISGIVTEMFNLDSEFCGEIIDER